jgi:hypothetical protein
MPYYPPAPAPSGGGGTITLTADTNIAAGSAASINSSGHAVQTWGPSRVASSSATPTATGNVLLGLDATHFLVVQAGTRIQAGSISGNTITLGTADTSAPSLAIIGGLYNVCVLDGTHFAIIYNGPTNATVVIGTLDGSNNISYGTPVQITASPLSGNGQIVALSATAFAAIYRIGTAGLVIAGTVSGTTITLGSGQQLTTNINTLGTSLQTNTSICVLSSALVATLYGDGANTNKTTVCAATISGTTVTLGTPVAFSTQTGNGIILALDSTHVFTGRGSNDSVQAVASISGTTFTFGSDVTSPIVGTIGGVKVLSSGSVITWAQSTAAMLFLIAISGTTLTYPATPVFCGRLLGSRTGTLISSVTLLGSSAGLLQDSFNNVYQFDGSLNLSPGISYLGVSNTGFFSVAGLDSATALIGVLLLTGTSATLQTIEIIKANGFNAAGPIGLTAAGATSGQQVTIAQSGVVTGFSGLTPGARYYHNGDGTLTTTDTGILAGIALSSSSILAMPLNNTKV